MAPLPCALIPEQGIFFISLLSYLSVAGWFLQSVKQESKNGSQPEYPRVISG